jgi:hypothetical protein
MLIAEESRMDQRERQVIDELFGKLPQVERQAPQRDAQAEAHIRQQVSAGRHADALVAD